MRFPASSFRPKRITYTPKILKKYIPPKKKLRQFLRIANYTFSKVLSSWNILDIYVKLPFKKKLPWLNHPCNIIQASLATWPHGAFPSRDTPRRTRPQDGPREGRSKHWGFKKARAMLTSEARARRRFCHAVSSSLLSSSSSPSFQISNRTRPFKNRWFFSKTQSSKWAQDLNKSIFQRKLSVWSNF